MATGCPHHSASCCASGDCARESGSAWARLISCIARPPGHFVRAILAGERCANQNWSRLLLRSLRHMGNFSLIEGGVISVAYRKEAVESGLRQIQPLHDAQVYLLIKFTIATDPPIRDAPAIICQLKCSPSSVIRESGYLRSFLRG